MNSTVYYYEEEEKKDQQLLVWLLWMDHIIHSGVRRRPVYTVHTVGREWSTWQKSLHENKKENSFFFFYYDLWSFTDTGQKKKNLRVGRLLRDSCGRTTPEVRGRTTVTDITWCCTDTLIIFIIIFIIWNNHNCHPVTSEPAWYYLNSSSQTGTVHCPWRSTDDQSANQPIHGCLSVDNFVF